MTHTLVYKLSFGLTYKHDDTTCFAWSELGKLGMKNRMIAASEPLRHLIATISIVGYAYDPRMVMALLSSYTLTWYNQLVLTVSTVYRPIYEGI